MTPLQNAQNAQPIPNGNLNQNKVSSSIVLKSLSVLLGIFFIFIGAMKITPHLSKDLHKDLVRIFFCFAFVQKGKKKQFCSRKIKKKKR